MEKELDELIAKYEEGNMTLITLKAELLRLFSVVARSELLRDYFVWHKKKGYVSHKPSDIDEFINEQ